MSTGEKEDAVVTNAALDSAGSASEHQIYDSKQEVDLNVVTSHPISLHSIGREFSDHEKHLLLRRLDMDDLEDDSDLPFSAVFMIEKIQNLSVDESIMILKDALEEHKDDINFSQEYVEIYNELINKAEVRGSVREDLAKSTEQEKSDPEVQVDDYSGSESLSDYKAYNWEFRAKVEAALKAFWSPYQEVRAVTTPYDDPNTPAETLRAYCISILWQGIGTFINTYFAARQPSVSFSSDIGQVFIYPCGVLWAAVMPNWSIPLPFGRKIKINDGPWTQKEQMYASLIYFVAGLENNIYKIIFVQKSNLLHTGWANWGYEILIGLSSSFMGFGIAGLMRSIYVYPVTAMWPNQLYSVAVNVALTAPEKKEKINGWTLSRYRFFFLIFGLSFIYFWFPDYIFQALSIFSWMTWIKKDNINLSAITGSNGGLGFNPIPSFDFNTNFYNSPLAQPVYTTVLMYIGSLISFFIVVGMWYSNYKWTGYLPINTQDLYDNTGNAYNITKILTSANKFDLKSYQEYSPTFYSAGLIMRYAGSFVAFPFVVTYICLVSYEPLWKGFKVVWRNLSRRRGSGYSNFNDPFCRMNSAYPEAPEWWFLAILVISLVLAIICVEIYPTGTPVWSIFLTLGLNIVFLVPFLQVYSTTGGYIRLTSVVELIMGYAIRGNGVAVMIAALFGYSIDEQAQNYLTNQKVAHYAKIPPRAMFRGQLLTTFINLVVTIAVVNWQVSFPGICTPNQKNRFTCPLAIQQLNDAVTWGIIGPYRVIEVLYPILKWSFLIGFLVAIPCALFYRFAPRKWTKYFEPNVIITGMVIWAPYNLTYYTGGLYFAYVFMYYIRHRFTAWWNKYTYLFYAGIQAGIAFSAVIIFFAVEYHPKSISWWGNNVVSEGVDGAGGAPRLNATLAPDGYFGPRIGHFS